MGRRRKQGERLPPYVYLAYGRYIYRPYMGVQDGKPIRGKEQRLCNANAAIAEVWRAYEAVTIDKTVTSATGTLRWTFDQYLASEQYRRLAPRTQQDYRGYAAKICNTPTQRGTFGDERVAACSAGVFRRYIDYQGERSITQANRQLSFIKSSLSWAVERDLITDNPARPVKRETEKPRTRLVTPAEFQLFDQHAPDPVKIAIRLAVSLRARLSEVVDLQWRDVGDTHITLRRRKGSKTQKISITPMAREALILAQKPKVMGPYVLQKHRGDKYTASGMETLIQRTWQRIQMENVSLERFTFHDLKAAGVSWFDGDKLKASGHRSAAMLRIYDRTIESVEGTDIFGTSRK